MNRKFVICFGLLIAGMLVTTNGAIGDGTFTVTQYSFTELMGYLSDAKHAINNPSSWSTDPISKPYNTIAFFYNGSTGNIHFRSYMVSFPGSITGIGSFGLVIRGNINIPDAGDWTFACGSDDGFKATISGHGFSGTFSCLPGRMFDTSLKTFRFPVAGNYALNMLYFNKGIGSVASDNNAAVEFSMAKGPHTSFDSSAFYLVQAVAGPEIYEVTFDSNNGTDEMDEQAFAHGEKQALAANAFTREGYCFVGWATSKDGAVEFKDGQEIEVTKDMTLFAVWSRPMTLQAESADWSSGSLTLRCEDDSSSASTHKYSLEYCNENGEWTAVDGAKNILATKGQNSAGQEVWIAKLTDTSFSSRLGGIPPVSYRVTDETGRFSAECITRNRFLLSVGYSAFLTGNTPKRGHYNDASEIKDLCVERGEFLSDNAHFRSNASATTEKVRAEMAYFAEHTQPGDLFVFYIATHGGDYDSKRNALLATYDGAYQVKHLLEDVRNFPSSVAVINVIMSCHSFAMTGSVNVRERINLWLAACGFGQCLGNVAWVTSCDAEQSSYTYLDEDHSRFGQSFIVNGFRHGCADMKLYGTEYGGGNTDGVITIGELGRYAQEFFKGLSDDFPSSVQLENEGLLDRIVLGKRTATSSWARPNIPENVNASQGDTKINISWTASGNASSYRIYRYPLDSPSEWKWLGISSGTTFKDGTATLKKEYGYRVKAVNPVGLSDLSTAAVGSRGTSKLIEFLNTVFGITTASADEYDAMEKTPAANGRNTIGECYALGINHEDPNDNLRISHFELQDGKPRLMLNHTEDGSGKSFLSDVRVLGTTALGESPQWDDVTDIANPDASGYRFFKATVELP